MAVPEGSPYINVRTGPSCSLHTSGKETVFEGALTAAEPATSSRVLFLYEEGNPRNYHAEQVDARFDKDEVAETFANCPCHQNIGKDLGRKACLALNKLRQQEE